MAGQPYRIAHFGDLHLSDFDEEFAWTVGMVEDAFGNGADHVLFTGDIVDMAEVDVIEGLMDALEAHGLGPKHFSLVPGNHDVYPLALPRGLTDVPRAIGGAARTLARRSQANHDRLMALIDRNLHRMAHGALFRNHAIPYSKQLAPGILLVGMDSTRSGTRDPRDWAAGQVDEEDVDVVAEHVQSLDDLTHCVVAMHHYPLDDFESVSEAFPMEFHEPDAATMRNWLQHMGATTVLCGHIHVDRTRTLAGGIRLHATESMPYIVDEDEGTTGRGYRMVMLHARGGVTTSLVGVNE